MTISNELIKQKFERIYAPYVPRSIYTVVKVWKRSTCPSVHEWVKKWNTIRSGKKEGSLTFATASMDLEIIMLSE